MDFKRSYPKLADYLSNRVDFSRKEQQQSRWHWFALIWINDCCNVITKTNIADCVHRNRCIDQRSCDDLVGDVVFLFGWAFSAYRYFAFSDFLFIEYRNIYKELADDLSWDLFLFLSFWSDGT